MSRQFYIFWLFMYNEYIYINKYNSMHFTFMTIFQLY